MNKQLLHTPEGVRDIYGEEYARKLSVETVMKNKINSYGYEDIQTPTFEFFDVFSREVGTTPSRELYKFFDKEGNTLVLRPDFTPSIARCAVADPPVMILDEATSSIDTHTEEIVQRGMDALMSGRTTFVIAHRLSTVRNSDAIIVLDHGRIIERGSHDELIAKRGTYYQLYTGAFELE